MAIICCVSPSPRLGAGATTEMVARTAAVAVSVVLPATPARLAVRVLVPGAVAMNTPLPSEVATEALEDVHVAVLVRSALVPSEYFPVAVSCVVSPAATLGFDGLTVMDDSVTGANIAVTVRVAVPETLATEAVTVDVPGATHVARPLPPTVTAAGLEELQAASAVTSRLVPSEYVPAAASC